MTYRLGRILRWLAVTVWFGIWFLGPAYLIASGTVIDPRDPFPHLLSLIGCGLLALGWVYITIGMALMDELPPPFDAA